MTLPAPKADVRLSGVWPMFDTTDLEVDRLATLTDTNNLSFGLGMRIEDPSMLFKWAPAALHVGRAPRRGDLYLRYRPPE